MTKAAERALAMQKKKTAITAAMEVLTDYLVEAPKRLGFKVSKDSGYYYILITSWAFAKPMIGISKQAVTVKMDRDDAWNAVYDYENETDLDTISTGVKEAVRDMIENAINPE